MARRLAGKDSSRRGRTPSGSDRGLVRPAIPARRLRAPQGAFRRAAQLVAKILEGRGASGDWTGTSGITSSAAAAAVAQSIPRSIGWLDNGDGSVSFAFAAPGDTNIDGTVDILDGANFLAGGKFDSGSPASWNEGDFGYDGVVDILDAADFLSTGLFDAGPYIPAAAAAAAAGM